MTINITGKNSLVEQLLAEELTKKGFKAETKIFESNQEFPIQIRKSKDGKNSTYELFGVGSSPKARVELTGGVNSSNFEEQLVDLIAKFFKDQK